MTSLIKRAQQAGQNYWRKTGGGQKVLFISGTLLLGAMLFHGLMLGATRSAINGPVSFRKAMTFAEAFWLMCWASGWLLPYFGLGRFGNAVLSGTIAAVSVGETFLMSLQVWRGVPSHYNFSTDFDILVFIGTGVGAGVLIIVLLVMMVLTRRLRSQPDSLRTAVRVGLGLTAFGYLAGLIMIANSGGVWQGLDSFPNFAAHFRGDRYRGPAENAVGGDLVMLHALGLHGLQITLLAVWLLTCTHTGERVRHALVRLIGGSYVAITGLLTLHSLSGLPLSQLDPLSLIGLIVAALMFVGGYCVVVWRLVSPALAHRQGQSRPQLL